MRAFTRARPAVMVVAALAAACAACSSSVCQLYSGPALAQRRRRLGRGRLPGHGHDRWRQGPPDVAAGRHRLALADGDRDALRDRGRQPGQGRRQRLRLPGERADYQAVGLPAECRGDRRLQARPGDHLQRHRRHHGQADRAVDPGARPARGGERVRRVQRVHAAGRRDRPRGPGHGGGSEAEGGRQPDRRVRAAARRTADVLLRARDRPVLLGDRLDLHRQPALAARHEEHRRHGEGRCRRRRLPEPVGRVHPEGQPGLHHPVRHWQHRRRAVRRHRQRPAWLVGADRGEEQAHHRAQRRHRVALGAADRPAAADGRRGHQVRRRDGHYGPRPGPRGDRKRRRGSVRGQPGMHGRPVDGHPARTSPVGGPDWPAPPSAGPARPSRRPISRPRGRVTRRRRRARPDQARPGDPRSRASCCSQPWSSASPSGRRAFAAADRRRARGQAAVASARLGSAARLRHRLADQAAEGRARRPGRLDAGRWRCCLPGHLPESAGRSLSARAWPPAPDSAPPSWWSPAAAWP